jgi:predicted ATPase
MSVIAIAGLPGSGKSGLMDELKLNGYARYNDINRDWDADFPKAKADAKAGRSVAICDIMFCDQEWREKLERDLGEPVRWIFFENDPWQCAKNCLFRFMFQKNYRPLQNEIQKILELSKIYRPAGDICTVPRGDQNVTKPQV